MTTHLVRELKELLVCADSRHLRLGWARELVLVGFLTVGFKVAVVEDSSPNTNNDEASVRTMDIILNEREEKAWEAGDTAQG